MTWGHFDPYCHLCILYCYLCILVGSYSTQVAVAYAEQGRGSQPRAVVLFDRPRLTAVLISVVEHTGRCDPDYGCLCCGGAHPTVVHRLTRWMLREYVWARFFVGSMTFLKRSRPGTSRSSRSY